MEWFHKCRTKSKPYHGTHWKANKWKSNELETVFNILIRIHFVICFLVWWENQFKWYDICNCVCVCVFHSGYCMTCWQRIYSLFIYIHWIEIYHWGSFPLVNGKRSSGEREKISSRVQRNVEYHHERQSSTWMCLCVCVFTLRLLKMACFVAF